VIVVTRDRIIASPRQPRSRDAVTLRASAGALAAFGAQPKVTAGFTLSGSARWRALSLQLEGRFDLPTPSDVPGLGSVSAMQFLAGLVPCAHYSVLATCAIGYLGAMRGVGSGVDFPRAETGLVAFAGGRAAVEVPLGSRIALRFHADLLFALAGVALDLQGTEVWKTPLVSAALGMAAVGSFR
jgi:hypothetical protein